MIEWALLIAYAIGYIASVRPIAVRTLESMVRYAETRRREDQQLYPSTWQNYHPVGDIVATDSGRIRATWYALAKALAWFVIIPVHLVAHTVVTPTEKQRAERRELERLRKLAAAEGLDWPEQAEEGK